MSLSMLGLGLIIVGWALQLRKSWKVRKELDARFVLAYAAGVVLLVVDGYLGGLYDLAALNLVSLVVSALVYLKIAKKI